MTGWPIREYHFMANDAEKTLHRKTKPSGLLWSEKRMTLAASYHGRNYGIV